MTAVEYSRFALRSLSMRATAIVILIIGFFVVFFVNTPRIPKNVSAVTFGADTVYADAPSCGGSCGDSGCGGACGDSGCDSGCM